MGSPRTHTCVHTPAHTHLPQGSATTRAPAYTGRANGKPWTTRHFRQEWSPTTSFRDPPRVEYTGPRKQNLKHEDSAQRQHEERPRPKRRTCPTVAGSLTSGYHGPRGVAQHSAADNEDSRAERFPFIFYRLGGAREMSRARRILGQGTEGVTLAWEAPLSPNQGRPADLCLLMTRVGVACPTWWSGASPGATDYHKCGCCGRKTEF